MKEKDYIIATNLTKVRAAISIIQDVLPGDDWGISKDQRGQILDQLHKVSGRLNKTVKIEDD